MTIAQVENQIKRVWRSSFQYELDQALETRLRETALTGVKAALEAALREELDVHLGRGSYVRSPHGTTPPDQHRSGFFKRAVETSYGHIPDLKVPKLRCGNKRRQWHILERYQTAQQIVLDKALYLYSLGLSIRDLQEALYLFLAHVLSRSAINRVTVAVQTTMNAWRHEALSATPPVLIVDGVWVTILIPTGETALDASGHERHCAKGEKRVILAVLAVWPDGQHQIIHYDIAHEESQASWSAVCQQLLARGLDPSAVRLVVSDGSSGLVEAVKSYLPTAALQRCTVHKVRGFERYLCYKDLPTTDTETGQSLTKEAARQQRRYAMKTEALEIFEAPTRPEAEQRLAQFVAKWQPVESAAVHNFQWGIKRCFTFYQVDATLHSLVRSSNLLERFFREFRNKADEIGAFPNEDSCLTVFHLVMVREHAKHNRVDFAKTG